MDGQVARQASEFRRQTGEAQQSKYNQRYAITPLACMSIMSLKHHPSSRILPPLACLVEASTASRAFSRGYTFPV